VGPRAVLDAVVTSSSCKTAVLCPPDEIFRFYVEANHFRLSDFLITEKI